MKVQLVFMAYTKHLAAVSIIQIWVTKKHSTQACCFIFISIRVTTLEAAGLYFAERGRNHCEQPSAPLSLVLVGDTNCSQGTPLQIVLKVKCNEIGPGLILT